MRDKNDLSEGGLKLQKKSWPIILIRQHSYSRGWTVFDFKILTRVRISPQKHRCVEQISMYSGQITFVRSVLCPEKRTNSKTSP